jgi:hypothetical protein
MKQMLTMFFLAGLLTFAAEPTPPASPTPIPIKDFAWLLKNATWDLYGGSEATPNPDGTIKFLDGGKVEGTNIAYITGWARAGGNKIKVFHASGRYWMFQYSAGGRQAKTTKERGSMAEDKLIKVQKDSIKNN